MQKSFSHYTVGKSFTNTKPKIATPSTKPINETNKEALDPTELAKEINPDETAKEPRKYGSTADTFLASKRKVQNPLTYATGNKQTPHLSKRTIVILSGVLLAVILLTILYLFVPSFQHMAPGNFGDKTNVSFAPFTQLLTASRDVIG